MTAWFINVSMHWLEMVLYRNCRESVLVRCRRLHSDYMYFLGMFIDSDITYKWRYMNDNSESWHLMIAYMISISRSRQKYLQALNSARNKYWTDPRCRILYFIQSCKRLLISKTDHGFPAMLCILLSLRVHVSFVVLIFKNVFIKLKKIWMLKWIVFEYMYLHRWILNYMQTKLDQMAE